MRWYEKIIGALGTVTNAVSHGYRMKSERYFVWQEDGENDLLAGNRHAEHAVTGTVDLFSKVEFDPWCDELRAALDAAGIAWHLNSVQFEEDTGFWHWEWVFEVTDGSESDI